MELVGLILVAAGILMLIFGNISFTKEKKVVDIGPVEINKNEKKTIAWPNYAGGIAIAAGVLIFIAGNKKRLSMKYLFLSVLVISLVNCSPKLSPDAGWARQRWVVVEMKGVPVQQSGGRRDAYINFEVNEKKNSGNGGCNQVNGNYTINKTSIDFGEVMSTKTSCEDIEFENTFISILGSIDHYEVRGNDLLLKKKRETLLVLRAK